MKENFCKPKMYLDIFHSCLPLVPQLSLSVDWVTVHRGGSESFIAMLVQMPL